MSLVPDYCGSSDSDSDSDTDSDSNNTAIYANVKKEATPVQLPSASRLLCGGAKSGGVLSNPYLEAESTKQAALEKHVKMIQNNEYIVEKNGKKICWNNRKGRCRYGNKCQYAHDSDIIHDDSLKPTIKPKIETTASDAGSPGKSNVNKRKISDLTDNSLPIKRIGTDFS